MVWISWVPNQNGVSLLYIMLDRVADHVQMGDKSRNENRNRVKKITPKGYELVRLCRLRGMIA